MEESEASGRYRVEREIGEGGMAIKRGHLWGGISTRSRTCAA